MNLAINPILCLDQHLEECTMDYKTLLEKYMRLVYRAESITFLERSTNHEPDDYFTEEEKLELQTITAKIEPPKRW